MTGFFTSLWYWMRMCASELSSFFFILFSFTFLWCWMPISASELLSFNFFSPHPQQDWININECWCIAKLFLPEQWLWIVAIILVHWNLKMSCHSLKPCKAFYDFQKTLKIICYYICICKFFEKTHFPWQTVYGKLNFELLAFEIVRSLLWLLRPWELYKYFLKKNSRSIILLGTVRKCPWPHFSYVKDENIKR